MYSDPYIVELERQKKSKNWRIVKVGYATVPLTDADGGSASASRVRDAMLYVRGVGHPSAVGDISPQVVCDVFDGAGRAVLAAGAVRTPGRRDAAFERLVGEWIGRCGPEARRRFGGVLRERDHDGLRRLLEADGVAKARAVSGEAGYSGTAALRLARYCAPDERWPVPQPSEAVLNLAVPYHDDAGATWRMHVPPPCEAARFHLRTEAFQGTGRLVAGEFDNGADALLITRK
ncbi:hypothetical protein [Streptomyces sp. NPDC057682]|uniref:hypothetical protein n=1 Tax=Streptomyces sp. NPDC057682 TaxID=3346210 RepID=UPI0036748A75